PSGLFPNPAQLFGVLLDDWRRTPGRGVYFVETADSGVLRQDVLRFDIDSHQRLDCSDVFGAAHALNAHVRGPRQRRVGVEFRFEISDERIHFLLLRLLRPPSTHPTPPPLPPPLTPNR